MVKEIVFEKEMLKKVCSHSSVNEASVLIAQNLVDTLFHCWEMGRKACSLSANQIGEFEEIIVISDKIHGNPMVMFNPQIIDCKESMDFWENNMCRPNMLYKNERAYSILVSFQDEKARWQKCWFSGKMSGIIQQEIDNLHGILPEKRATDFIECVETIKNAFELNK